MRRALRIIAVMSIGLILAYVLFLAVQTLFMRSGFRMSILIQLGTILVGFGSLMFQVRKLKPKYQSEEMESALDDHITQNETPEKPIPIILKFANGLFGVWVGFIAVALVGLIRTRSTLEEGVNFDVWFAPMLITAILCTYTCLFIVGVGVIEFFTPSRNQILESDIK